MIEERGNLWDLEGDARCILTNCVVSTRGLVMGAGVAGEAAQRYWDLPILWGDLIARRYKNHVFGTWVESSHKADGSLDLLIAFPTKLHYAKPSPPGMILESAVELMQLVDKFHLERVLLPRPGSGHGGLDYFGDVRPLIEPVLDDRVVVITF